MTKTHDPSLRSHLRGLLLSAAAALLLSAPARAAFTNLNLGTLDAPYTYVSFAFDQLPDGRLFYASEGSLFRETTYGGTAVTTVATGGESFDPSSLKIYSGTLGAIGGYGTIYLFNPTSNSNTVTPIQGINLQNFSLTFRDATSLYVGGANGSQLNSAPFGGSPSPKHAISYVKLDGTKTLTVIDNISEYSGDFTTDSLGNLIVSNYDNGDVFRFSKTQVDAVINGAAPLHLSDGTRLGNVGDTVSIAIDAQGRIWSAGYLHAGFSLFDPTTNGTSSYAPAGGNVNYQVATYTVGGQEYISYLDTARSSPGTPITYGFDLAQNVPEPSSWLLLSSATLLLGLRRRHVDRL